MRVRKLDTNGDMVFGHNGNDYLVDSPQAVAQEIYTSLRLLLGEWFLDTTKGVPWLTQVVGQRGSKTNYDDVVKAAIRNVQGVIDLQNYFSTLDPRTRSLIIDTATVITVFGPINLTNLPVGYGYVYGD